MNKSKKITLIISIALVSIILLIGVTYALNYTQTGTNQQLVLGDIWMKYEEKNGLTISDAVPGSNYSNYFEFTISGTNTYTKKDIYYDFLLVKGDLPNGKSEDYRIPDKYLKFKLVSVDSSNQETEIFTDKTYPSLENTRIYVETIGAGVTNYSKTYRLYMTIDNSLLIGNTSDAVFTFSEWESAFASIKVDVTGNFLEKKILTYNDCFETSTLSDGTLQITGYYKYDENSTNELYKNPLCTSDVVIPSEIDGVSVTGVANYSFYEKKLTSLKVESGITYIDEAAFMKNLLTNIDIPNSVISIGPAAFNDNKLLDSEAYIYARTDNNGDGVAEIDATTIISYAGAERTNIIIPSGVVNISTGAFMYIELENVMISNTVTTIGDSAFFWCKISNIDGMNNVRYIGTVAFTGNNFITINLPSVVQIGSSAFADSPNLETIRIGDKIASIEIQIVTNNTNLKSITFDLPCSAVKGNESVNETYLFGYPWLSDEEPWNQPPSESVTIYGTNGEVCDVFTKN